MEQFEPLLHFDWPSPPQSTTIRNVANKLIHQLNGDYSTFQNDSSPIIKDVRSSTTESTTEPNLLATVSDVLSENTTTVIKEVFSSTTEALNKLNGGKTTNLFSSIASEATTPTLGLTDSIVSNQTITETMFNNETLGEDLFVTVSSNISFLSPSIDTDQPASQTTIGNILTSLSSNITSDTSGITAAVDSNKTFTDVITESILNTETVATDFITSVSSSISEVSTRSNVTTTEETGTTISSVISNVTENVVKNVTEVFTTTSANTTDANDIDVTNNNDIVVYVILGIVIALLIIIILTSYVCFKKCKSHYSKSRDYYITQYTTSTNC